MGLIFVELRTVTTCMNTAWQLGQKAMTTRVHMTNLFVPENLCLEKKDYSSINNFTITFRKVQQITFF